MLLLHKVNDVSIGSSFMFSPRPTQQQTCVGGCIDKAWLAQCHLVSFHSWGLIWISIFPLHPTSVTSVQHWVLGEPIHFSACSWMKTLSRHLVICFKKSRICNLRQMENPIITITVRILQITTNSAPARYFRANNKCSQCMVPCTHHHTQLPPPLPLSLVSDTVLCFFWHVDSTSCLTVIGSGLGGDGNIVMFCSFFTLQQLSLSFPGCMLISVWNAGVWEIASTHWQVTLLARA